MNCQRAEFSLPTGLHYLNCAYMSPLSKTVEQAGIRAVEQKRNPVNVSPEEYFAVPDRLRAAFAQLINGDRHRVALLPSVSYAMAIAVNHLRIDPGQNVVVIGEEFPSAVLPWRRLTRELGRTLRTVQAPAQTRRGALWNERVWNAIDRDTAVVVLPHVHWSDGTLFNIREIAQRARDVGAAVLIDGTQSIGALPFDTQEVQPDLLVTAGYKWLMGGYGLSLAHFGPRFDGAVPLEDAWLNQQGSDDFSQLAQYRDAYRNDATRFDGGERAHFILAAMLRASIEQLLAWGVGNIQQYCADLTKPWLDNAEQLGIWVEEPEYRAAHLFGLRSTHPCDLSVVAAMLKSNDVHVSVRGDAIRVSPHVYNDSSDVDALFNALRVANFSMPHKHRPLTSSVSVTY